MAEIKDFALVKLICSIISSSEHIMKIAEEHLLKLYGPLDLKSPLFEFNLTEYYEKDMGKNLKRRFLSFVSLLSPERLSEIKIQTNSMEKEIKVELKASHRAVNLDPGYVTSSALIMATSKNFSHRIPLQQGIYAHLELLLAKNKAITLSWTYPDFRREKYQQFIIEVKKLYLTQLK